MCKLKRCFASFVLALLLSSVFLVPCFAETWGEGIAITASVGDRDSSAIQYYHVTLPFSGRTSLYTGDSVTFTKQPLTVRSALYAPADYDRTMILSLGIQNNTAGYDSWFNGVNQYTNPASLYYSDSRWDGADTNGLVEYPDAVTEANDVYEVYGDAGEIFNFQVTIPAYSNSFEFSTAGFVTFTTEAYPWHIVSYGGYIIDTADDTILEVVEQILQNTSDLSVNFGNLVLTVNDILAELRAVGADTATTVELLEGLTDLSDRQLQRLESISSSVDAIYAFLTQALAQESEQLSQEVGEVADQIRQNARDEELYRVELQTNYENLNLRGFSFGSVAGALELIGNIFTDVWNSLGSWSILYTYPLMLGIILLVIGRLGKTGGGNSSRNSEHRGGEGGA